MLLVEYINDSDTHVHVFVHPVIISITISQIVLCIDCDKSINRPIFTKISITHTNFDNID